MNHPMQPAIRIYGPALELVRPEIKADRFKQADVKTRGSVSLFYDSGRLSEGYVIQTGVFRKVLLGVSYTPDELPTYQEWLQIKPHNLPKRAAEREQPDPDEIQYLRLGQDPAVHIMDKLRHYHQTDHAGQLIDSRTLETAEAAFDIVLTSLHGRLPAVSIDPVIEQGIPSRLDRCA
jgi:hypothetical protein